MADFGIINRGSFIDIDLKIQDTTRQGMLINAILEKNRVLENVENQPVLERGGSIKDIILNKTGFRYGSLLWFYIQTQNENALPYIRQTTTNSLNDLIKSKQILSFSSLEISIEKRNLTISFNYSIKTNENNKFNYKLNI
jgi:hypothetical protein